MTKLIFNATAWAVIASLFGIYVGDKGGFQRGVIVTSKVFISGMDNSDKVTQKCISDMRK